MKQIDAITYLAFTIPISTLAIYNLKYLLPQTHTIKIVLTIAVALLNPYIYHLITQDWINSIENVCIAIFLLTQLGLFNRTWNTFSFIFIGIASVINPSNFILGLQGIINSKQQTKQKSISLVVSTAITLVGSCCYFGWFELWSHYDLLFFPRTFTPQANVLWIMYSHMFIRYITLYQLCFQLILIFTLYLANQLRIPLELKLMIPFYFKVLCNYRCSELTLVCAMGIEVVILLKFLPKLLGKLESIANTFDKIKIIILTLVAFVAEGSLFIVNKIFLFKFLNDFTLNTGYLLIYFSVFWGIRSLYLSQIVSTTVNLEGDLDKIQEEEQTQQLKQKSE